MRKAEMTIPRPPLKKMPLGTCQKLAGGSGVGGVGILNLGSEMR